VRHDNEYPLPGVRSSLLRTEESPPVRSIEEQVCQLFNQYAPNLTRRLRIAFRRDDAEEVTQEAFLRLHETLLSGTEISEPGGWLLTVARRIMIDRAKRDAKFALPLDFERESTSPTQEDVWIGQRRLVEVRLAMMRDLTDIERRCLIERARGLTLGQVAASLSLPDYRRVAKIIGRAARKIRRRVPE
jgi:DNA-directed RNA polymerase specialized sigma24 family protein